MLVRLFLGAATGSADTESRQLHNLDLAITEYPDEPVNYLLRGEYWMNQGDIHQAQDDLMKTIALASEALANSDWGYMYQSYIDRAEEMLAAIA